MVMWPSQTAILLLWILCTITYYPGICGLKVQCNENDQQKLQNFKQEVTDASGLLSTWSREQDCCRWTGIHCENFTGRVTTLSLSCPQYEQGCLAGEFNLSNLLELEFLNYLDLSYNSLLLTAPHGCGNYSSRLLYLDLSHNHPKLRIDDLTWLRCVLSLKYLNLGSIGLPISHWLQSVTMLPSLSELHLSECQLHDINTSLEYVNFTSLQVLDLSKNDFYSQQLPNWLFNLSRDFFYLDLSENYFQGPLPQTLLNLHNLRSLNLHQNKLSGSISNWLGQHENLQSLDLSYNIFHGTIPKTLGNLSSLTELYLGSNLLINGSLPESLGQLSNLEILYVEDTSLTGVVSEMNFVKLSNLKKLFLSSCAFTFHFDPHWIPSFQLQQLSLGYVDPELPAWIYTQKSLFFVKITHSRILLEAQNKFWTFVAEIEFTKLLNNSISGDVSKVLLNSRIAWWSYNNLTGGLPQLSPSVTVLILDSNSLLGPISPLLCQKMEGESSLSLLSLSDNLFFGGLTDCWMNWKSLVHVHMDNNKLTGKIPHSMSSLSNLKSLYLNKNNLFGDIPPSLQNCQRLGILNLAENKFSGNIPFSISQSIKVLILRSNQFNGNIPPQICQLSSLIVFDISHNGMSGPIPNCLHNITALVSLNKSTESFSFKIKLLNSSITIWYDVQLPIKGHQLKYRSSQELIRMVDLSHNNLIGTIPPEMFTLTALQSLNLSQNELMGRISKEIGNLRLLESLDLSSNRLEGEIPQSMSELSFLGFLNLSFNNFIGQIPPTTKLQSFDELSYIGNPELCGAPLTKKCTKQEKPNSTKPVEENEDEHEFLSWFYIGMGVGFATGFWAVCASLFFNRTWRHAYFKFLDDLKEQLYVFVVLKTNIFQ